jgi:hypothetical protein
VYKQLLGFREKTAYLAAEYFISNDKARGVLEPWLLFLRRESCEDNWAKVARDDGRLGSDEKTCDSYGGVTVQKVYVKRERMHVALNIDDDAGCTLDVA